MSVRACIAVIITLGLAACLSSLNDEGEFCENRDNCVSELECVVVNDPDAVCLPIPTEREQRRCTVDADCVLSTGQLWPLDADCIDGFCRCDFGFNCGFETGVAFEPETCRCVPVARFGDPCLSSDTCESGTFCSGGICERE